MVHGVKCSFVIWLMMVVATDLIINGNANYASINLMFWTLANTSHNNQFGCGTRQLSVVVAAVMQYNAKITGGGWRA